MKPQLLLLRHRTCPGVVGLGYDGEKPNLYLLGSFFVQTVVRLPLPRRDVRNASEWVRVVLS
jgi:hypothetical protein